VDQKRKLIEKLESLLKKKLIRPNCFAFSDSDSMNAEYYAYIHTYILAV